MFSNLNFGSINGPGRRILGQIECIVWHVAFSIITMLVTGIDIKSMIYYDLFQLKQLIKWCWNLLGAILLTKSVSFTKNKIPSSLQTLTVPLAKFFLSVASFANPIKILLGNSLFYLAVFEKKTIVLNNCKI